VSTRTAKSSFGIHASAVAMPADPHSAEERKKADDFDEFLL
jgi:hypothetical protein